MKRRSFVKNVSLSSVAVPFMFKNVKFQAISEKLFEYSRGAEDRVLVIIRLNGGNDGLNTFIPLDQYDNLVKQRENVIQPMESIIKLNDTNGMHSVMGGMASMFNDGTLSVIQNVGYDNQNRSHFRSKDIWSTGSTDLNVTSGWLGRRYDGLYPGFPDAYPDTDNPDPFVISMGYQVSATCLGEEGNFSYPVPDPFDDVQLGDYSQADDGTLYGSHLHYMSTVVSQTNSYGIRVKAAAEKGNTLSQAYDPNNQIAVYLRYVAQMISGGLTTKVYVLNLDGFDTHAAQIDTNDKTVGAHASLLKKLSDAIHAFQDDLKLLGIDHRVAGMTLSEFGRQIASNSSNGTDHGDAAPLFLFGSCISNAILGPNPQISDQLVDQAGVPMKIDFRDIYASVLKDWFLVPEADAQPLFEHQVTFYPLLQACSLGISDFDQLDISSSVYPNPCTEQAQLILTGQGDHMRVGLYDLRGKLLRTVFEGALAPGRHELPIKTADLSKGAYLIKIQRKSGTESLSLIRN